MHLHNINYDIPELGSWTDIHPDIKWLRMPLPMALDHINLYLLRDGDGWAVLDTGFYCDVTRDHWQTILSKLSQPLTRVIVTHMHPDHIGCAGWLCESHNIDLYISQTEYFATRALRAGANGASDTGDKRYYQRAGYNAEQITQFTSGEGGFSKIVSPVPLNFQRLRGGETLHIGQHAWRLIEGNGHSPEHISLYCEALNILISGDHVLPDITPNIGAYSTQPDSNPLQMYLSSLEAFKALPNTCLVLPSHRRPFIDPVSRVETIVEHHHQHLARILAFCTSPKTILDIMGLMFPRKLDGAGYFFATAEAYAHVNFLLYKEQLIRGEKEGIYHYQTI
jgi:glyoxylase-like metal-dependent hydrolase (beta-lactamase superfamily II)